MVAIILIFLMFCYFYVRTKKERKEHVNKWLALKDIPEESIITGEVIQFHEEKQRFYYDKFVFMTEITVKYNDKHIRAKRLVPIIDPIDKTNINIGDKVTCIGYWKNRNFYFYKYSTNK